MGHGSIGLLQVRFFSLFSSFYFLLLKFPIILWVFLLTRHALIWGDLNARNQSNAF